ncbi:hypothetical protein GIB67_005714 [Kingdonia uniflora]|uniref:Uncharacterized protein n=1 Tax=Kingdonia uniflora TaxID=39325 RepID=A0A7J7KVI1_9MAGN|nr:hypothetical protein GIB67_005714 [Kingdonia uniflora]
MGNETTQSANKNDKKRKKTLSMTQVREQNANKVVDSTNINENQIQQPILRNANWFNMEALAKEQENIRKGKMHRSKENNLQIEEITLTQQQPSIAANNAPSKRSLAQRARREKEKQIMMMDATINNTYNNTNVGINEENSFTVATSKRALAQRVRREREKRNKTCETRKINNIHRDVYFNGETSKQQYSRCQEARNEAIAPHASPMNDVNNHWNTLENAGKNSDNCGVSPSKILEPFLDEHFFNDDNMDSDYEFNVDPLIHESRHYLGNMDIECPSCHVLYWLDKKLTNSSRYRPLFGTCCKQGKIRLPILQPLPPAIQVLYDDVSSHAKSF